jgi:biopolymer transport protein ExbB/TolQ
MEPMKTSYHLDWMHHTVPLWAVLWSSLLVFALISGTVLQFEITKLKSQIDANTLDMASKATPEERSAIVASMQSQIANNTRTIELETNRQRREIEAMDSRMRDMADEVHKRLDLQTGRIDKLLDDLRDELVHDYLLPVKPRHPDDQR